MARRKKKRREQTKRSWMVGFLMIAMLAFVASQIPWDRIIQRNKAKASSAQSAQSTQSSFSTKSKDTTFENEGKLTFTGADGKEKVSVDIEVADSEEERNLGLMYRRSLPNLGGMLFVFDQERQQNFWMKNTYLPLDFVFIDSKNTIVSMKKNVPPMSEAGVPSGVPAMYVLELNAGFTDGYDLKIGDAVTIQR